MNPEGRDTSAFERAVLPCLDDAYAVARYLLRDGCEAQDAVQDAFVRTLGCYDAGTVAGGRAWLLTIVRRCCYDRLTRRWPQERMVVGEGVLAGVPDRAVQRLSYREISQVVVWPMGTVTSRLSRARRRLMRALEGVLAADGR